MTDGCIIQIKYYESDVVNMSKFEDLFKEYVSIDVTDRGGFFLSKVQTIDGYSKVFPLIWDLIETFISKVAAADKVLDISEYAMIQGLAMHRHGVPFDPEEFTLRLGKFVADGADTTIAEAAFTMLPEYVRDDVVMLLIIFASVDGVLSEAEADWISTIAF